MRIFIAVGKFAHHTFDLLFGGLEFVFFYELGQNQAQCHAAFGLLVKYIGRQIQVGSIGHALVNEILLHFGSQAGGFFGHQGFGQLDFSGFEQGFHCRFFGLLCSAARNFARHVFLYFFAHFGHIAIGNAQGFGKLLVHFRQSGFRNIGQGDGEHGGFAGHIFAVIIFREIHFHIFALACFQAQYAGFEFGQHLAVAQHKRVILRSAALKRCAVDFAFEIDNHAVAVLGFALNVVEAGALLAQDFDGFVDFGIAHFGGNFFHFLCAQIAHGHFGKHFENGSHFKGFFVVLLVHTFKTGHTGHAQIFAHGNIVECFLSPLVHHIVLHTGAIHGFHHFHRRFARAEAVDFHAALGLLQTFVGFGVNLAPRQRQNNFALEVF